MNCFYCRYYREGYMENKCKLTGAYNFRKQDNCNLINNDGIVNKIELRKLIEIPIVIEDTEEFTCQDCEYYDSYNGLCKKTKEEKNFLDSVCKDFKYVPF